jgi:hypothetical protein
MCSIAQTAVIRATSWANWSILTIFAAPPTASMQSRMTRVGIRRKRRNLKIVESVAGILERELAPTIREWLKQVNLVPELTTVKLSDANRTDHLPKLFNDVIFRLRLARDVEPPLSLSAAAHGRTRFEQGYSASMLIEESRIFQVATFGTLHVHQKNLDQSQVLLDVMIIADEADRQLTQAVRSLMAAQSAA